VYAQTIGKLVMEITCLVSMCSSPSASPQASVAPFRSAGQHSPWCGIEW